MSEELDRIAQAGPALTMLSWGRLRPLDKVVR
jgi:hypothetical protein